GANVDTGLLNLAKGEDERIYSVKRPHWRGHHIPLRLANELLYYALSSHNKLPMPRSAILQIENVLYWGSEVVDGWSALTPSHLVPLNEAQRELLRHTFVTSD